MDHILAPAALLLLALPASALMLPPPPDSLGPHGVWVLAGGAPGSPLPEDLLTDPLVTGLLINAGWRYIETEDDVYDWSDLDAKVEAVTAAGKQVGFSIFSHRGYLVTPDWLYQKGSVGFPYHYGSPQGPLLVMAIPWDPVYQAEWTEFIQVFGDRYASNPNVRVVHGVHMFLPTFPVDVANWTAIGFTNARVTEAWNRITDAWLDAFPGRGVITWAFPITIATPQEPLVVARALAAHGYAKAPGRFLLGSEGLSAGTPDPLLGPTPGRWQLEWENSPHIAMQMLCSVTPAAGVPNCQLPSLPECLFARAVQIGLDYRMPYFEVYPPDLRRPSFRPAVALAAAGTLANDALRDALVASGQALPVLTSPGPGSVPVCPRT